MKSFAISCGSYRTINGNIICKIFIGNDMTDGRSLIYKMKGKGSNIEHCGTPERTGDQSEAYPLLSSC